MSLILRELQSSLQTFQGLKAESERFLTWNCYRTKQNIISIQGASAEDVDIAVAAARKAFQGEWRTFSATKRGEYLYRLAEIIYRDRELIASIDAWDNGKVVRPLESCRVP